MTTDMITRLRECAEYKLNEAWRRMDGGADLCIASALAADAADAQSALEAYGREKVREGVQRVADAIENRCYEDPALAGHGFIALIHDVVLAAMEKEDGE